VTNFTSNYNKKRTVFRAKPVLKNPILKYMLAMETGGLFIMDMILDLPSQAAVMGG